MTKNTKLAPGLYRLHWKSGGTSLAAVGCLSNGDNWYAPVNWTSTTTAGIACTAWRLVESVQVVAVAG